MRKPLSVPQCSFYSRRLAPRALVLAAVLVVPALGTVVAPPVAAAPLTFVVNSAADAPDATSGDGVCSTMAGLCTLRAAIQEANAHSGPDTITFNIPGTGVQTIQISSTLPVLSDMSGVTIDGFTQPGAVPNNAPLTDNAHLAVQIRGKGTDFDAFDITSGNNVIKGLAIFNVFRGLYLTGPNASFNRIVGDFIGTDTAGTYFYNYPPGGGYYNGDGISLYNGASYNQIGDVALADRNVISGNGFKGIALENIPSGGPVTKYNVIYNNIIGLSPSGGPMGNPDHGIDLDHGASYNIMGGTQPGQRNVISGSGQNGIEISHPMSTTNDYGNQIIGNYIGTDVTGTNAYSYTATYQTGINIEDGAISTTVAYNVVGNAGQDALAFYATTADNTYSNNVHDNRIGITLSGVPMPVGGAAILLGYLAYDETIGPNNIIAGNPGGINLCDRCGAQHDTITRNSIYGNGNAGIYIGTNDNGNIPPPTVSGATTDQVTGTACVNCIVEIFAADRGTGARGQGQTYLATGAAGSNGSFTVSVAVSQDTCMTATSTDRNGNTSAFALDVCAVAAPTATGTATASSIPTMAPPAATGTPTATGGWRTQSSGTTSWLKGVGCASASACMAVGDNGTIVATSNGSTWTAQSSGTTALLYSVACPSTSACVAVGTSGVILATSNGGSTWTAQSSGTTQYFYGVSCPSTGICTAVGGNGAIRATSNGGSTWTAQSSGTTQFLRAVACPSTGICTAVGDSGTIVSTTGSSWTSRTSGTTAALKAISCPSTSACTAAGTSGAILASTDGGNTWSAQSSGVTFTLRGLAMLSASTGFSVGDSSSLLRYLP